MYRSSVSTDLRPLIEKAFEDRSLTAQPEVRDAIFEVVRLCDAGKLRAAERGPDGTWATNTWIKQAILLFLAVSPFYEEQAGPLAFRDKVPVKKALDGVRVVPPGTVRYGAHLEPGVILMPGYVNIGAYVGANTMVDTWATVGSCAQIGRDCHLSGGVGIGGVLEPPGARPVIVEDGVFVGSRAVIVEGMLVESEAVIGAGVVLTSSTPIIDVTGSEPVELRGRIPARSVVIPGTRPKKFPAGEFGVPCALVVGQRSASTDRKVGLNAALRDFGVPV